MKRIGSHNCDVISVLSGLLLGDGYAINRSGDGGRLWFSLRQSIILNEYLFSLYKFLFNKGYYSNNKPRKYLIKIKNINKIYYGFEFNTIINRSLVWVYDLF